MKKTVLSLLLFLSALLPAGADILAAKLRTEPAQPYVGQETSLFVELATDEDCEIRNIGVVGFPTTNYVSLGRLVELPSQRKVDEEGRGWIHYRFRATIRAAVPFETRPEPIVRFEIGTVSPGFFGSRWMWRPYHVKADCEPLVVRELPSDGRPEGFSGAVGRFSLEMTADDHVVWPEDIVNLTLRLRGEGYAGETPPAPPSLPRELFRTYAPKAAPREDASSFLLTQAVIPLSTQAVEIAAATFPYFDPSEGRYKVASSEPVRLVFRKREAGAVPAVREVRVVAPQEKEGAGQPLEVTETTLRAASRLLAPVLAGLLAGLVALALARGLGMKYRYALPIALLVAVLLFLVVRDRQRSQATAVWTTNRPVPLRLAPSSNARVTLELQSGTEVAPLEKDGEWVRVRSHGRCGWLPARSVEGGTAGTR